jgi:thiol-disulfide isomerase/thioredoxin
MYACNSQQINQKVTEANGTEKLLGQVNKNAFVNDSFAKWFDSGFKGYEVDEKTLLPLANDLKNYEIKAFMGTWCGDSKREIPRFYKILETANYPIGQLTMVAVDHVKPNYKKSPGGEEKGLNIIKVPTFIFYKDGKEVSRIVESPVESLEKDIGAIVTGKNYIPNYSQAAVVPTRPID